MTSDRRAAADDKAHGETPVLSDWLMDTLRPPRPEPAAEKAAVTAADSPPAVVAPEAAEATGVQELAASDSPDQVIASDDGEAKAVAAESAEQPVEDAEQPAESAEQLAENPITLAPQVLPDEEQASELEPDPALLFLLQERHVRRTQRVMLAAALLGVLLLGGGYLLLKRGDSKPATDAVTVAAPQPSPVPEKPAAPAPPEDMDSTESEAADDEAVPVMKTGLSAAFKSPVAPASTDPAAATPGGPSTARYPDLPRDVLMQLEKAAEHSPPTP